MANFGGIPQIDPNDQAAAVSPQSLALARALAQQQQQQGIETSPIRSPWQGVARVVQSMVGGNAQYQANQKEQAARSQQIAQAMGALQPGADPSSGVKAALNPWTSPEMGSALLQANLPVRVPYQGGTIAIDKRTQQPIPGSFIPEDKMITEKVVGGVETQSPLRANPNGTYSAVPITGAGAQPAPGASPVTPPIPAGQPGTAPAPPMDGSGPGGSSIQGAVGPSQEWPVGQPMPPPVSPRMQQLTQYGIQSTGALEHAKSIGGELAKAQVKPVADDIEEGNKAPDTINTLDSITDAYKSALPGGGIKGGPYGHLRLAATQAANQMFPGLVDKDKLAAAESIDKLNVQLATRLVKEISNRGTNLELQQGIKSNPGLLMSDQGAIYMANLLRQQAVQKQEIGALATKVADPSGWASQKQSYYQAHPLISPFTGKPLANAQAVAADMAVLKGAGGHSQEEIEAESARRGLK